MTLKLGIVTALKKEFTTLSSGNYELHKPIQLTENISGIISGMGSSNAIQSANILKDKYPDMQGIISWGVAAGLTPDLKTGDVVLPRYIIPVGGESAELNNSLLTSLEQKLSRFFFVKPETSLASTNELLMDATSKKKLHHNTGGQAADMESGALLEFAQQNNLSFSAIRTISDSLDDVIPAAVANYTKEDGSVQLWGLLSEVITNPVQWKQLINIGMNFKKARKRLSVISEVVLNGDR